MAHLSNEEFLTRLAALFEQTKEKGTVFLTQKRFTHEPEASTSTSPTTEGADVEMREPDAEREWPLLIRATDGNGKKDVKVKISTIVQPASADTFLAAYSDLLRTHFSSTLRPKRKKADLARQKALKLAKRRAAKAKARGEEVDPAALAAAATSAAGGGGGGQFVLRLPKVVGPRRGNGVKKRRRTQKAREKAVERYKAGKARKRGADDA